MTANAIVIPVHNRRQLTLETLQLLADDGIFSWATVLVIDDGSTDGTAEAIAANFAPVVVLRGEGTWWWCGAIRRGMEWALSRGARHIFWLNDDCHPPRGGLKILHEFVSRENCVAWINAGTPAGWSYGAQRKTAWGIRRCTAPEEMRGQVDTFSGNCVCLPRTWIDLVGLPHDHLFPHGLGDFDYGLRLRAVNAPLRALPTLGARSANPSAAVTERWLSTPRSMREIWSEFRSPKSFFYFRAWRSFALRHWGPLWGWFVFAAPYVRWSLIALVRAASPTAASYLATRRGKIR